jgi:hypothetical protein
MEIYDVPGKLVDRVELNSFNQPYHYYRHQAGILFLRITSGESAVSVKKVVIY